MLGLTNSWLPVHNLCKQWNQLCRYINHSKSKSTILKSMKLKFSCDFIIYFSLQCFSFFKITADFIVYISCGLAINNLLIPALIEHWCLDYQPLYSTVEQSSGHTVLKLLPDHQSIIKKRYSGSFVTNIGFSIEF